MDTETRVRQRLCMLDPDRCGDLRIYLLRSPRPVADMDGSGVLRINMSLLVLVRSVTELDFVLAHELAHLALDHFQAQRGKGWDATRAEIEADAWARARLLELGLDHCAGARLLSRIARSHELEPAQQEQLPLRIEKLGCAGAASNPDYVPGPTCPREVLELRA